MSETVKTDIRKYSLDELKVWAQAQKEPAFRAKQIDEWLWKKRAVSFDEMTNLSKGLRQKLEDHFVINGIVLDAKQKSNDGTIKCRFKLHDGHKIESVLIPVPDSDRYTVCVSSQVGCSLSCAFCATGMMKRMRNLDGAEIYDQYVLINEMCEEEFGHPLTNVVYMGMGEPLLNYKGTLESIHLLTSEKGLNISPKRITISTAGIAKMITKLADDDTGVNLALSLHAADDEKRDKIMPINESNTLAALMDSISYFYEKTGNKISYEYIAFKDFNDSIEDANNLAALCRRFPVRINVIEYNPIPGLTFVKSSKDTLDAFAKHLKSKGIMMTVRRSRGKDIDAACGQLANQE
jgi:23S rRNA (adenine2503-C2)-methyltransferase